jgi:D-3-phosphoglycerate dehydrogenase
MFKYHCLNPISAVGMNKLDENYVKTENADEADVILVRSAKINNYSSMIKRKPTLNIR